MFVQKQLFQQSLLIVIVALSFGEYMEPSRYELIQNILRETNYDHSFPPNSESVTHVSVQLSVTDLSSENDIKKDIEFTIYLRMNWTDRRLNFEGSNTSYDVISLGDDIVDDIWLPDLYFHHERKSDLHGFFANNQLVYLHKNGNILYSGRFSIESHCPMEFRKYPFDKQTCPIIIQSYAFPSDILRLNWNGGKNAIKIDNESKNNLKVDQDSVKHTFDPPYPDAVAVFSTLTANLVYERQTASFIIMGPPFLFVVIALLSFLIRDDFSTRITLITGTSVSNFVHWTGIRSTLPSDSSFNYFDILMIVNFIYFGVILTIHIGKRYWKQYKQRVTTEVNNDVAEICSDRNEQICVRKSRKENKQQQLLSSHIEFQQASNKGFNGDYEMQSVTTEVNKDVAQTCSGNNELISVKKSPKEYKQKQLLTSHREYPQALDEEYIDTEDIKEDFSQMLRENPQITLSTKFKKAMKISKKDPRCSRAYQVDCGAKVERWFLDFIEESKEKLFLNLLNEKAKGAKNWKRASMMIDHDPRYHDINDPTKREGWFTEWFNGISKLETLAEQNTDGNCSHSTLAETDVTCSKPTLAEPQKKGSCSIPMFMERKPDNTLILMEPDPARTRLLSNSTSSEAKSKCQAKTCETLNRYNDEILFGVSLSAYITFFLVFVFEYWKTK